MEGSGFRVFLFLQCGNLSVQLLAHHLADLLVGSVGVVQIHGSGKEIFETGHECVAHLVGGDIYFYRGLIAVNLFLTDFVFEIDQSWVEVVGEHLVHCGVHAFFVIVVVPSFGAQIKGTLFVYLLDSILILILNSFEELIHRLRWGHLRFG